MYLYRFFTLLPNFKSCTFLGPKYIALCIPVVNYLALVPRGKTKRIGVISLLNRMCFYLRDRVYLEMNRVLQLACSGLSYQGISVFHLVFHRYLLE